MGMPELGSTLVCEPTFPPTKQLQTDWERGNVPDRLGLKSLCVRQRAARPILVQPNSTIVATKSATFTRKLQMWLPAVRLKGFANNAAGMPELEIIFETLECARQRGGTLRTCFHSPVTLVRAALYVSVNKHFKYLLSTSFKRQGTVSVRKWLLVL